MNKIAMRVAVLVASLGVSGAAFAGSEAATTVNGRPMVAPVADSQAQKANPEVGKRAVVADAKSSSEQKSTLEAGKGTAVVADAKSTTEQKAGHDAKQHKPEATTKSDAKAVTPAPVAVQDNNVKK
ncbi:MAG: hypothetical protein H7836_15195 [Magnetococcus sp. YQC-3]